jgi:protein-disulfide isomerase
MASQNEWRAGVNPRDTLFRVGNGAGLSNQQIEACIKDPANLKASEERTNAAVKAGVTGTPAFYVNGVQIVSPGEEGATMADLSKAIEAELAKG